MLYQQGIWILACCVLVTMASMPGGITDNERPVDPKLKKTLEPLKSELLAKVSALTTTSSSSNGGSYSTNDDDEPQQSAEPIAYKSQVVAGVNYFVKYLISPSGQYFHARIFKSLKGDVKLIKVIGPKTSADPITYF